LPTTVIIALLYGLQLAKGEPQELGWLFEFLKVNGELGQWYEGKYGKEKIQLRLPIVNASQDRKTLWSQKLRETLSRSYISEKNLSKITLETRKSQLREGFKMDY